MSSHTPDTKVISSPLCCVIDFQTYHKYASFPPEDRVGDCQKIKMYLSDPDIAI